MSTTITITQPDTSDLAMPPALTDQRHGLIIADKESQATALQVIAECKRREKLVDRTLEESISSAHHTHKSLTTLRKKLKDPYEKLRKPLERENGEYVREERRRAEAVALERAEKLRRQEETEALEMAASLERAGENDQAEAVLEAATTAPAPIVQAEPDLAEVDGVSTRELWSAEVTDLVKLAKYVAEHPEWASLIEPNMKSLNMLARQQKDALTLPGVRAKSSLSTAVRT